MQIFSVAVNSRNLKVHIFKTVVLKIEAIVTEARNVTLFILKLY